MFYAEYIPYKTFGGGGKCCGHCGPVEMRKFAPCSQWHSSHADLSERKWNKWNSPFSSLAVWRIVYVRAFHISLRSERNIFVGYVNAHAAAKMKINFKKSPGRPLIFLKMANNCVACCRRWAIFVLIFFKFNFWPKNQSKLMKFKKINFRNNLWILWIFSDFFQTFPNGIND